MSYSYMSLLELSRSLKRERLLVDAERVSLQRLNGEVADAVDQLYQLCWVTRHQQSNLDALIMSRTGATPSQCCQTDAQLQAAGFTDSHHRLSRHDALYAELVRHVRCRPPLVARLLLQLAGESPDRLAQLVDTSYAGLYGSCVLPDDELRLLQVLRQLMAVQVAGAEAPQRLLRRGSCAFSRLYRVFSEGLFAAKLFLTSALHQPIMQLIMDDEWQLDIDPQQALARLTAEERCQRFGPSTAETHSASVASYQLAVTERLVSLAERFVTHIADNVDCFPSSLAWIIRTLHGLLVKEDRCDPGQARAIAVDLVFTFFICPAVVDPVQYGILEAPVSPAARHNLIQVGQILQVLALDQWQDVEPRCRALYERFDRARMAALLSTILNASDGHMESAGSSGSEDLPMSAMHCSGGGAVAQLAGLSRSAVLVTRPQLEQLVELVRVAAADTGDADERRELEALLSHLPTTAAVKDEANGGVRTPDALAGPAVVGSHSPDRGGLERGTPPRRRPGGSILNKVQKKVRGRSGVEAGTAGGGDQSPDVTLSEPLEVLVVSLNVPPVCVGLASEEAVLSGQAAEDGDGCSLNGHCGKSAGRPLRVETDEGADSVSSVSGPADTVEKRTRFSLTSRDDVSIGNTSDNLEAISEAASNVSDSSSLEEAGDDNYKDDNLSDMVSANVSGRETPNVSGRNTPSSQVTDGTSGGASRSTRPASVVEAAVKSDASGIEDRFGKFSIRPLAAGADEAVSQISDTWSTDVIASSDTETGETPAPLTSRQLLELCRGGGSSLAPGGPPSTAEPSETASEAWSTDVLASDSERDRLNEVDGDADAVSVATARSDEAPVSVLVAAAVPLPGSPAASIRPSASASSVPLSSYSTGSRQERGRQMSGESVSSDFSSASGLQRESVAAAAGGRPRPDQACGGDGLPPPPLPQNPPSRSSSGPGAIPKSISFDKSAEKADDNRGDRRGFFKNFKLFKNRRGSRETPPVPLDRCPVPLAMDRMDSEALDDMLAKYRGKQADQPPSSDARDGKSEAAGDQYHQQQLLKLTIDPNNVQASYAFADAKQKLRRVLSAANVQAMWLRAAASGEQSAADRDGGGRCPLLTFLRLQLSEAVSLQDHGLMARLHETIRCVSLFDATARRRLLESLRQDLSARAAYVDYLLRSREQLLATLAHVQLVARHVTHSRGVTTRALIDKCVLLFLERHTAPVQRFYGEFQLLAASDEKTERLAAFLAQLSDWLLQDACWQTADGQQVDLALRAVEQALMAQLYLPALYPNGDADLSRDQVLYGHMQRLARSVTPNHRDLRIPPAYHYEAPWPSAQAEIVALNAYKTACDKVTCVTRCCSTIMNLLQIGSERGVPAADDLTPVLVFVLIKACPPSLLSTIQYVDSFYGARLAGQDQYWWIQFCSAVEFIKTMDY